MLLKSELKEWLKHPVTKAFQEALEMECEQSRTDLIETLDNSTMDREETYDAVLVNKVTRLTYEQFFNDKSKETIENMMSEHGLLIEEEESNE